MWKYLLISLFTCSLFAEDLDCVENFPLWVVQGNKKVKHEVSVCLNHPHYELISKNCVDHNCLANRMKATWNPELYSQFANPFHLNCRQRQGTPRFVSYKSDYGTEQTSICQFSDESFISDY